MKDLAYLAAIELDKNLGDAFQGATSLTIEGMVLQLI